MSRSRAAAEPVRALGAAVCAMLAAGALWPRPAGAQPEGALSCSHAVVVTLPGVTWGDIARLEPPALLEAVRTGAMGSMSVRTNSPRTSYASGYATIGAGARVDGVRSAGGVAARSPSPEARRPAGFVARDVVVSGVADMRTLARAAGYAARPGALGSALRDTLLAAVGNADHGDPPPLPVGFDRWSLLAAMDARGRVDLAATGSALVRAERAAPYGVATDGAALRAALDTVLREPCSAVVVDHGDLARADMAAEAGAPGAEADFERALRRTDAFVADVAAALDPARDLLLVVSPTSPADAAQAHLGVAIAVGPGFPAGSVLESASTRRPGIVTLPDVAPTVLRHMEVGAPAAMNGRPWLARSSAGGRVADAAELDRESVFVDGLKSDVATGFVVFQVAVYLAGIPLLARRERRNPGAPLGRWPELAALAVVAFPLSTYVAGAAEGHELGAGGYVALLVGLDAALVCALAVALRDPLERLLALTGLTAAVLLADLVLGSRLQLNTAFGYSPIVAGRFSGAGNITFAVLGASGLITGALIAHRWSETRAALIAVAALYATVVVVDGAPQFGSDVGGTLALVPALGLTWLLLAGRRPRLRTVVVSGVAAVAVLVAFLVVDLARPPEARTHLARLFEDVAARGLPVLVETVERKARANLRVFSSTVFTLFVPPALGVMAWLLRRPRGRWERLARVYPRLRAALVGGLLLAVLGFAVNDSGIVIPAVVLSYLVPMALLVHLALEQQGTA